MVKVFSYQRAELEALKVEDLKNLVRKHNLHNQIKRYSKMRKADLVEALLAHSKLQKGKRKYARPKKMKNKLVPELDEPLYKEGVAIGAKKQFESKYGKIESSPKRRAPAAFIEIPRRMRSRRPPKRDPAEGYR